MRMLNDHCSTIHTRTMIRGYYYKENKEAENRLHLGDRRRRQSKNMLLGTVGKLEGLWNLFNICHNLQTWNLMRKMVFGQTHILHIQELRRKQNISLKHYESTVPKPTTASWRTHSSGGEKNQAPITWNHKLSIMAARTHARWWQNITC